MTSRNTSDGTIIDALSNYMVEARRLDLPEGVALKAKHHILDTIAAMVSGKTLKPGQVAVQYAELLGGTPEAQVVGTSILTNAVNAALANGMMAHADESDDTMGSAVVPAALALAEKYNASGEAFLKAVTLGYDVSSRVERALLPGGVSLQENPLGNFSRHSIRGVFGAAAAASAFTNLDPTRIRYVLSYAAQQASGITSSLSDLEHVEKAFHTGGMPARSGVAAVTMVEAGFTGVTDVVEGHNNFFDTFSGETNPGALIEELGSRYEVMSNVIKKYCVGGPIQVPVDALVNIIARHRVGPDQLERIVVYTATGENRLTGAQQTMPDINLRYLLAVTLLDGDLSFEACHDQARIQSPQVVDIIDRIDVQADPMLVSTENPRQAVIEFITKDGQTYRDHVAVVRGAPESPMTTEEVVKKERGLLAMVLGDNKADQVIAAVLNLESLDSVRELRPLLQG
ncbi:MAG: MmgE/PrpD family protein [Dehalococcoidia bacterium]